jgi:hypothetical protein
MDWRFFMIRIGTRTKKRNFQEIYSFPVRAFEEHAFRVKSAYEDKYKGLTVIVDNIYDTDIETLLPPPKPESKSESEPEPIQDQSTEKRYPEIKTTTRIKFKFHMDENFYRKYSRLQRLINAAKDRIYRLMNEAKKELKNNNELILEVGGGDICLDQKCIIFDCKTKPIIEIKDVVSS